MTGHDTVGFLVIPVAIYDPAQRYGTVGLDLSQLKQQCHRLDYYQHGRSKYRKGVQSNHAFVDE